MVRMFTHRCLALGVFMALVMAPARAEDLSQRFGVSGFVGSAFPLGPQEVRDITDSAGLNLGGMFSLQMGPHLGAGIAYENMRLGNGNHVAPLSLMMLLRFM